MKQHQKGMMSLLITGMLLIGALLFSLGSAKTVFYQVKRAQNEVDARKAHWAAEGGLECGFAKISIDNDPSLFTSTYLDADCKRNGIKNLAIDFAGDDKYSLSVSYLEDKKVMKRAFDMGLNIDSGAIKSTSDLIIGGTTTMEPPDPDSHDGSGWECTSIRYSTVIGAFGTIDNKGVNLLSAKPYAAFDSFGDDCLATHRTLEWSSLKQDITLDSLMNPFKDIFGKERSEWAQIKADHGWDFGHATPASPQVCREAIVDEIDDGKKRVWVAGSCELNQDDLDVLKPKMASVGGVLILIHDGVMSIEGAANLKGMLYHFNYTFSPEVDGSSWVGFGAKDILTDPLTLKEAREAAYGVGTAVKADQASYAQIGAIVFEGGQVFDTAGQIAVFSQGMSFKYNRDIIRDLVNKQPSKWIEGSWHDF